MRAPMWSWIAPLALSLASPALAAAPAAGATSGTSGITGIEGLSSTVFEQGESSFSGLGLRLRIKSAALLSNVELLPTIEYWRNSSTVANFDVSTVRRDATLGADARWMFPGETWRPYLGAGFGLHFLSSELNAPALGVPHASDGLTKGGLSVLGGVEFAPKSRVSNFLEAKGHLIGRDKQLKVNFGISWNFQ